MASSTVKDSLVAELADARTRMTGLSRALRYDLQVVPRLRANIARNQVAWFSGAALVGLILSQFLSRRPPVVSVGSSSDNVPAKAGKATLAVTALKLTIDFAKPALLRYIAARFRAPHAGASR